MRTQHKLEEITRKIDNIKYMIIHNFNQDIKLIEDKIECKYDQEQYEEMVMTTENNLHNDLIPLYRQQKYYEGISNNIEDELDDLFSSIKLSRQETKFSDQHVIELFDDIFDRIILNIQEQPTYEDIHQEFLERGYSDFQNNLFDEYFEFYVNYRELENVYNFVNDNDDCESIYSIATIVDLFDNIYNDYDEMNDLNDFIERSYFDRTEENQHQRFEYYYQKYQEYQNYQTDDEDEFRVYDLELEHPIVLCEMCCGQPVEYKTICRHVFCHNCVEKYIVESRECLTCRDYLDGIFHIKN